MAKFAITISFNEHCGSERSRFLFARIWNRACKRAYGKKKHLRPLGYGAVDWTNRDMSHIHVMALLDNRQDWFLECLQESCKHFQRRFESWSKQIQTEDEEIQYMKYIESKRIAKTEIVFGNT